MTTSTMPSSPVSTTDEPTARKRSLVSVVWVTWLLALTLSFVGYATASLDTFRPVSADEVSIMAVSSKLAQEGVLGSDLYSGYYNADRHFFINLPAQHVWQALAFRLAGTGVAQARWVSVLFAVVLLWTVGWLAWRWYDLPTALVATFLLLLWRSDLTAAYPGLSILGVARSARYDVTTVAWIWLTLAAFTALAQQPGRGRGGDGYIAWSSLWRALAVGACAGVAALTHFIGLFVVPLVALVWLGLRGRRVLRDERTWWMVGGFLACVLPYLVWIALHLDDFSGQMAKYGDRAAFGAAGFWLQNVSTELRRYQPLVQGLQHWGNPYRAYIGPSFLLLVLAPSLGYLFVRIVRGARLRQPGRLGDVLVFGSLAIFPALLALLEQTKTPLYALVLWPSLCVTVAVMLVALLRWALRGPGLGVVRLGAVAAVFAFLGLVAWDGRDGYRTDWEQVGQVTSYDVLGQRIAAAIPPQARVLGEYRWWWALHDHPYLGINTVYFQARAAFAQSGQLPDLALLLSEAGADGPVDFILTNNNLVGTQFDFPPGFREQFWDWVASCTTPQQRWDDRTYGRIDLYRIESERPGCLVQK